MAGSTNKTEKPSIPSSSSSSSSCSSFSLILNMASNLVTFLRILFLVVGTVDMAIVIYAIYIDGLPFRTDLLTPWLVATVVDFYIHVLILSAWIFCKEASWISSIVWTVILVCLGSMATAAYILLQIFKLSPEESSQDPMYHILLGHRNKYGKEWRKNCSSVTWARLIFSCLGFLMLGTLIYTLITDGSPFRKEILNVWMTVTIFDFYFNVVPLAVWVAYKERSWISALFWIILIICFGSITTCVYIVRQLLQLTSEDPVYLILVNSSKRSENEHERPLSSEDTTRSQ